MGQLSGRQLRHILTPPSTARQIKEMPLRRAYLRAASYADRLSLSHGTKMDSPTSNLAKPYLPLLERAGTGIPVSIGNEVDIYNIPFAPEWSPICACTMSQFQAKITIKNGTNISTDTNVSCPDFRPGQDKSGAKIGTNKNGGNLPFFKTGTNIRTRNGARLGGAGQTGQKAESLVLLSRPHQRHI